MKLPFPCRIAIKDTKTFHSGLPKYTKIGIFGQKIHHLATPQSAIDGKRFALVFQQGLPDFSLYKIPKRGKIYQISTNYTKCP
jgi:hypothetical protein